MAIIGGLLLYCGLIQFGFGEAVDSVAKDLMVTSLERSIDVASQLVKINTKLTLSNEGQTSLKYFHFAIEDSAYDRLSYIGASVSKKCLKIYFFFTGFIFWAAFFAVFQMLTNSDNTFWLIVF